MRLYRWTYAMSAISIVVVENCVNAFYYLYSNSTEVTSRGKDFVYLMGIGNVPNFYAQNQINDDRVNTENSNYFNLLADCKIIFEHILHIS